MLLAVRGPRAHSVLSAVCTDTGSTYNNHSYLQIQDAVNPVRWQLCACVRSCGMPFFTITNTIFSNMHLSHVVGSASPAARSSTKELALCCPYCP